MHAGYMWCIYIYKKSLKYRTKIIIYYKEELFAKCVRLYYGDWRIAVWKLARLLIDLMLRLVHDQASTLQEIVLWKYTAESLIFLAEGMVI
jgi:hypothetical protein